MGRLVFIALFHCSCISLEGQTIDQGILQLTQLQFDDTCCWRKWSAEGQFMEAAEQIKLFLHKSPNVTNPHSLRWHLGQMYAFGGKTRPAIKAFRSTYHIGYKWFGDDDSQAWYYYAKGNIAFLKRNPARLERIIRRWNQRLPHSINLEALEVMHAHMDESYYDVFRNM